MDVRVYGFPPSMILKSEDFILLAALYTIGIDQYTLLDGTQKDCFYKPNRDTSPYLTPYLNEIFT